MMETSTCMAAKEITSINSVNFQELVCWCGGDRIVNMTKVPTPRVFFYMRSIMKNKTKSETTNKNRNNR